MAAPLAELILFRAIDPEASTTKITNAPALRANRFDRMSPFSMYTGFVLRSPLAARALRAF